VNFSSVRDWCVRNDAPYRVVVPARMGATFMPHFGATPALCAPVPMEQPEMYVAEIPDARIVGGSETVYVGDEWLLDLAGTERGSRYVFRSAPLGAPVQTIEVGVMFQNQCGANYFHWLVEQLPRLSLLEDCLPLIVDERVLQVPQLAQALAVVSKREIIPLVEGVTYAVKRLVLPSRLAWMPPDLRCGESLEVGDLLLSQEAVAFLRKLRYPSHPKRKIYVERIPRTAPARLSNADEVKQTFISLGYESVRPSCMTFDEQRALFAEASVIASESGAGLTNMAFASPRTILICLWSSPTQVSVYADLTGHAGQRALFVAGIPGTSDLAIPEFQFPFAMDCPSLVRSVAKI
jgi:Capsular polysaccharide biosynthesis protein